MYKFEKLLKTFRSNKLFYTLTGVQIIFLMLYYVLTRDIEQPGGVMEAFSFLFKYPESFIFALILGISCWCLWVCSFIGLLAAVPLVQDYYDNYNNEYYEEDIKIIISKLVLVLGLAILETIFLEYLLSIIIVVVVIFGVIYLSTSNN